MESWAPLADVLLQREALACRLGEGRPPREFAGLFVGHDDAERALATLPGLDGPAPQAVAEVRARFDEALARAREGFADTLSGSSPFATACRSARLSTADAEVLAVLAAVERMPARQRLVCYIQDSVQQPRVVLATLARMFGGGHPAERCVAPGSSLRRAELVEVAATGPWATRACSVAARVAWHLSGDGSADPELPAGSRRLAGDHNGAPGLLLVNGADRETRMRAVADRWPGAGRLVCPVPKNGGEWAAVVREATLGGLVVVLEVEAPPDEAARDAIARAAHLGWVLSSAAELALETVPPLAWDEVRVTGGEAGADDWLRALGRPPDPAYRLDREQLRLVAEAVRSGDGSLGAGVRRLAGGHLDAVAQRIRPRRGWDDLILPPDDARLLRELAARHRGRDTVYRRWGFSPVPSAGTVALFAGPSGTGKTLAAEVIAGDLGLDLYKVDLSSVVSKYIGETEKNLDRVFGAAAAGDLVLFFDEADALFGKRSEVSDAHDRYANIEVAYLLQRLESYDGLVVLATNLQRNIDTAFLRRISVAVDFVLPELAERRAIWSRSFPEGAPVDGLDVEFLARQFKVSGGIIRNATLAAAFLAAEEGAPIGMRHAVLAMKREFQKLGRLRTEVDFDRYFDLVSRE